MAHPILVSAHFMDKNNRLCIHGHYEFFAQICGVNYNVFVVAEVLAWVQAF
jgi:hypothetical protein